MLNKYTTEEKLRCLEALLNNIEDYRFHSDFEEDSFEIKIKARQLRDHDDKVAINFGDDFEILNKMFDDLRQENR